MGQVPAGVSDDEYLGWVPTRHRPAEGGLVLGVAHDEQGGVEQSGKAGGLEERPTRLGGTDDDAPGAGEEGRGKVRRGQRLGGRPADPSPQVVNAVEERADGDDAVGAEGREERFEVWRGQRRVEEDHRPGVGGGDGRGENERLVVREGAGKVDSFRRRGGGLAG
jgi:hypothetical protein